jgi:Rha family phage regulatory protein
MRLKEKSPECGHTRGFESNDKAKESDMTNTTRKSAEVIQLRPAECIAIQGGRPVTTSFQVAQVFGKEHRNVMAKLRKLDAPDHFLTANFSAVNYEHRGNQYEAYEMTKDGFVFLVMGFTGKKAAEFKIAYIEAFNAMEKALHPDTLTAPQQRQIQQIVNKLAHQPGNSHAAVYRSLKDKFRVGKYDQIPANQYPAACRYLGAEPLEGEWLPAEESVVGETLNDTLARLTEQVKKPNSYPVEMFMPLVQAVLERRGGLCHYPIDTAKPSKTIGRTGWLTAEAVMDPSFGRPVESLLNELKAAGCDVEGCRAEYEGLYLLAHRLKVVSKEMERISEMGLRFGRNTTFAA